MFLGVIVIVASPDRAHNNGVIQIRIGLAKSMTEWLCVFPIG
jgi:hypothetical protein